MSSIDAKAALDALVAESWEALVSREPMVALGAGRRVEHLRRSDLAEAEATAAGARDRQARLDLIDLTGFDRTDRTTVAYLHHWFEIERDAPERWWTGFAIAPYWLGGLSALPRQLFPPLDLEDPVETERYLRLAGEFVDLIEALREQVLAQAERGWRMPKPALANVRKTIEGVAAMAAAAILPVADKAASDATRAAAGAIVKNGLRPAFARLQAAIGPEYEAAAPQAVGMIHQPGGAQAYRVWLRYHLGSALDPAEIHRVGLDEVARLAAEMTRVRRERFGDDGDEAAFHERLRHDPRARVPTAEALAATYERHLDRMAPVFERLFRNPPRATATVRRLPVELEASMTFGIYQPPSQPGGKGVYNFSGHGIPDRLQMNAAAVIFHELIPGHHVQVARQQENEALPPLRKALFGWTTFVEGWAEYASGLGQEAGLLDDPYDYYGFLSHQRFVAQRLVVDTGLNALGWTLDEAYAYMSANTLERPEQVTSELLRYATDMPAQALCYRWGYLQFQTLRIKAEAALGRDFDLADFHEAILDQGCLPMPVLEQSLAAWTNDRLASAENSDDTKC